MLPVRYLHIRAAISSGAIGGRPPGHRPLKTDAARGDKMQIWRRNFLSMFSGGAQFDEWLERLRRKRR
ncbi:hypothetical protein AU467_28950 [Mesorhizobium loti]|uniref:Uncharacterized protein n=1 Tax=Rhizobium loti TaxID=381 RepID=A0A101KQ32_RHILI|nr:hypothetical protein AU467_28950 [Mesorhizobium loti]